MTTQDKENTGEIYKVRCKVNDKCYIGQAISYTGKHHKRYGAIGRWRNHVMKAQSSQSRYSEGTIWNAIKTYGPEQFELEILEVCDASILNEREEHYIRLYDTVANGYNILDGKARLFDNKQWSVNQRTEHSALKKQVEKDLPMYVVYVKARPLRGQSEGYAVINFPGSRAKYFTSKKLTLEAKKELALNHLKMLMSS